MDTRLQLCFASITHSRDRKSLRFLLGAIMKQYLNRKLQDFIPTWSSLSGWDDCWMNLRRCMSAWRTPERSLDSRRVRGSEISHQHALTSPSRRPFEQSGTLATIHPACRVTRAAP